MIIDFNEIKDEKDREIYVQIRQIIDRMFVDTLNEHAETLNHNFHVCFNEHIQTFRNRLKKQLKEEIEEGNDKLECLQDWMEHNVEQIYLHLSAIIPLVEEYDRMVADGKAPSGKPN